MCKGDFDALTLDVYDGVERFVGHLVGEEVFQSVAADDALSVVKDGQSGIEVGIVAEHVLDEFRMETVSDEECRVRFEGDERAVLLLGLSGFVVDEPSLFECGAMEFAVTVGACGEFQCQGIDRLQSDTVQADAGGILVVVVFSAGVEFRYGRYEASEGDAAPVVAYGCHAIVDVDLNFPAETFVEFVDGIVDALLEEDVDAVFGLASVAKASDVHTRSEADMFHVVEVAYGFIAIVAGVSGGFLNFKKVFCHGIR